MCSRFLCLVFVVRVRCLAGTQLPFQVEIITLGFVWPTSPSTLLFTGPAFQTGLEKIQRDYADVFNASQVFLYDPNVRDCTDLAAQCDFLLGRYFYERKTSPNMTALIVPGCGDTIFTNRLAAQWNVLYITSVYTDAAIRTKTLSPTWVSTTPAAVSNFAILYLTLFRRYNWTTVYFIGDLAANPFYSGTAKTIFGQFQSQPGNQGIFRIINSTSSSDYAPILEEFRRTSRICAFFGHARFMKSLLEQAAAANMTDGNYIYIGLDTFHNIKFGNFTWNEFSAFSENLVLAAALRSLLVVSLAESVNKIKPEGEYLLDIWSNRTGTVFNFSNPEHEKATPYTFASHAAVEIFGQVLNESLGDSGADMFDPNDGRAFASRFLNRRFQTTVSNVFIDNVGDSRVALALRQFNMTSGHLKTVAVQFADSKRLTDVADIHWPNDQGPPSNEPRCGYLNERLSCILASVGVTAISIPVAFCLLIVLCAMAAWMRRRVHRNVTSAIWWRLDYMSNYSNDVQAKRESLISAAAI